jgi:ParB family transcriptional regulator, chromosome partitioning protein
MQGIIDDVYIHNICDSPKSLRNNNLDYNESESDEELARSIREKGLLQPIIVRPKQSDFEIVAGNRRLHACKRLGWKKITCHILDVDDKTAFEISLSENVQRESLSPIDEANAFRDYVTDFGYGGVSELASKIGKSPSYITRRIKLLNLHPDVINSITSSTINRSMAQELSYVKDKSQQPKLASLITKGQLSLREARGLLKNVDKEYFTKDVCLDNEIKVESPKDSIQKREDMLNKSVIVLRIAANRLATIIEGMEDDWLFREILMHHKSVVNVQIDLLIKEKRKLRHRIPLSY